jgi:hypothetical protein
MKKCFKYLLVSAAVIGSAATQNTFAGNQDRAGQAGATELLINPWGRSSGFAGANSASVRGLEAMFLNVAGTAFTKKTELMFAYTNWLSGSDINIKSFGFSQHVGETGCLALGITAMDFGDIMITTVDLPEGGIGNFNPRFMNLGLSYAKGFSDNIYGGMTVKVISESIADVKARGVALDAGIQYVTGAMDNIKFGIALKNIGPKMRYSGDGLSFRTPLPNGNNGTFTVEQRSAPFELPSLVNIGGTYDFYLSKDSAAVKMHRLTVAGNFTSNSFTKDEFRLGLEYGFKSFFMVRAGYNYEKGITGNDDERTTAFTGFCGGATIEIPFGNEKKSTFGLDYSYRATNPFDGVHTIGARINL